MTQPPSNRSQAQPAPPITLRLPPDLAAGLDAWIAAQDPPPTRAAAIQRLLAAALAAEPRRAGAYRATRAGPSGTVDEWRAEASDDEDAAHRLGQHLKSRIESRADGYGLEDTVSLIRPDGEIVTVARIKEMIARLTGWKTAPTADHALDGEWGD